MISLVKRGYLTDYGGGIPAVRSDHQGSRGSGHDERAEFSAPYVLAGSPDIVAVGHTGNGSIGEFNKHIPKGFSLAFAAPRRDGADDMI